MRAVGVASKKLRRENCVHSIIEFVNKLLSYAEGAPSPILKALNDRRGNRFQKFSARIFFARDDTTTKIPKKQTPFVCQRGANPIP